MCQLGAEMNTKFGLCIVAVTLIVVSMFVACVEEDKAPEAEYSTPTHTPTPTSSPTPTPSATLGNTYTNSISMEFLLIPAGDFEMGSPSTGADDFEYWAEAPVHQVAIQNAFYMCSYEITQGQWRAVMGSNPSFFTGDDLPVEQVSWDDVQEFIKKLNAKEGTDKYRLPSEAEWEYACRAGTTTRYSFGDSDLKLGEYAWYDDEFGETHPVGQKKPNPWGLYDMHGNVWEWVQDTFHGNYNGAPSDGSAWEGGSGSPRIIRGGSWLDGAYYCRSAKRRVDDPGNRRGTVGFRLVRDV
jgi:formylglycine-generating enzyme required for sulfatase activity